MKDPDAAMRAKVALFNVGDEIMPTKTRHIVRRFEKVGKKRIEGRQIVFRHVSTAAGCAGRLA